MFLTNHPALHPAQHELEAQAKREEAEALARTHCNNAVAAADECATFEDQDVEAHQG